jgi:hypothetical protein
VIAVLCVSAAHLSEVLPFFSLVEGVNIVIGLLLVCLLVWVWGGLGS